WGRATRLSASECRDLDPTFQGTTSDQYSKNRFRSRSHPSSEITSDLARSTARNPVKGPALSRTTRLGSRHESAPELLPIRPYLSSGRQRFAGQVLSAKSHFLFFASCPKGGKLCLYPYFNPFGYGE